MKIINMICSDLILEIIPILNRKELISKNGIISDDVKKLSNLVLKEISDYKSEFLEKNISKEQLRSNNISNYLKEAEIMAKVRDTHETQPPLRSDGFNTEMGQFNIRNGLEFPEFKHKRVLEPEDI